jgi:hypothetical protein
MVGLLHLSVLLAILLQDLSLGLVHHPLLVKHVVGVVGVATGCRESSMVHWARLVTGGPHALPPGLVALVSDEEHGNIREVGGIHEVPLTKLHECSMGSLLECVVHVFPDGRHGPSLPARLLGVDGDVNVNLTAPHIEVMGNQTAILGLGLIAKVLRHAPQEPSQPGIVQTIGVQSIIGSNMAIGVELPLSETKCENRSTCHPPNRDNNQI